MKIWHQANPVMPKISLDKHAGYKDKFDYMATKLKAVNAQAREMGGRLSTVNEDEHKKEMGIAESVEGRKASREGQAAQRFSRMFQKARGASWKPFERVSGARMNKEKNL